MDRSRLATIIFDSGRKIPESEYQSICEDIVNDRFTINPLSIEYKKRESIYENLLFVLDDNSRVLLSEEIIEKINSLNTNKDELIEYMRKDIVNFGKILEVLNGN
jgi:hypothetical protein